MKNPDLEYQNSVASTPKPTLSRYVATGMLLGIVTYIVLQLYIFVSGNVNFLPFVLVMGKNYPAGSLPNSGIGGGWVSGPLLFLFIVLGFLAGWIYYQIRMRM
ncbi:MAG TPA: hypothetical protein VEL49_03785 [Ktedonobacteraceae bacterium]|nr:hypothetical protein [Ktedonobacteraceae bacterium]